jgi:hypothetical protein
VHPRSMNTALPSPFNARDFPSVLLVRSLCGGGLRFDAPASAVSRLAGYPNSICRERSSFAKAGYPQMQAWSRMAVDSIQRPKLGPKWQRRRGKVLDPGPPGRGPPVSKRPHSPREFTPPIRTG